MPAEEMSYQLFQEQNSIQQRISILHVVVNGQLFTIYSEYHNEWIYSGPVEEPVKQVRWVKHIYDEIICGFKVEVDGRVIRLETCASYRDIIKAIPTIKNEATLQQIQDMTDEELGDDLYEVALKYARLLQVVKQQSSLFDFIVQIDRLNGEKERLQAQLEQLKQTNERLQGKLDACRQQCHQYETQLSGLRQERIDFKVALLNKVKQALQD